MEEGYLGKALVREFHFSRDGRRGRASPVDIVRRSIPGQRKQDVQGL